MRLTLIQEKEFWKKVKKSDGCWNWGGGVNARGYGYHCVGRMTLAAHRLSYALIHGEIPTGLEIDHACGNIICVNPDHLRLATHAENCRNKKLFSNNTSGYKGVSWHNGSGKWRAQLRLKGVSINLGLFKTKEAAYDAYCEAAEKYHGKFANLGKERGK